MVCVCVGGGGGGGGGRKSIQYTHIKGITYCISRPSIKSIILPSPAISCQQAEYDGC